MNKKKERIIYCSNLHCFTLEHKAHVHAKKIPNKQTKTKKQN